MQNLVISIPFALTNDDKTNIITQLVDPSYGIIVPSDIKTVSSTSYCAKNNGKNILDISFSSGFFTGYYIYIYYDESVDSIKLKEVTKKVLSQFVQEKYTRQYLNF